MNNYVSFCEILYVYSQELVKNESETASLEVYSLSSFITALTDLTALD